MVDHTKVYCGGLAAVDGMGMVTTFGVGVKVEGGKVTLKGTDKKRGAFTAILGKGKLDLT